MAWDVAFDPIFRTEFDGLAEEVQDELLALVEVLRTVGPHLRRLRSDTLNGSRHANMKELRFDAADGAWRVAYAFDPQRQAILLVAGDKSGVSSKRFYRALIERADTRFDQHLESFGRSGGP